MDGSGENAAWEAILSARQAADPRTILADASRHPLLSLFAPIVGIPPRRPMVVAQFGQSLDGRIATPTGHSHYINGPAALAHLHRLRAVVDAVVIGVGTALADDPRLTVRRVPGENPARVVLDPSGRLPDEAQVLAEDGARRILVQSTERTRRPGIEVIRLAAAKGGFPPAAVLGALRERGLHRILVEGGGVTVCRFLAAGTVQRLHLCIAPLILGSGPTGLSLPPIARLDDAIRPRASIYPLGDDVLFDCDLDGEGRLAAAQ